jgi:putative spermidine/putrescine transport system ATP-binding protein
LFVTHDQEEAMSIADRIAVMNAGVIVQEGPPRQIYEKPQSLFVADFVGMANILPGRVENGRLFIHQQGIPISGCSIPDGSPLRCVIRPEQVRLIESTQTDLNGMIERTTFLGEHTNYLLRLLPDVGNAVRLTATLPAQQAVFHIGQTVGIQINSSAVHLFEDQA